ncbi:undecaprenyldiphospho-muramoylpentapeptide beta-N-acetylglucosaminyltransferase [Nostocoides sp. F2B08]|uniref:undecaprenyldiphospho-muramoylpentapeptide beta-N-acetylglucosaminyltransferase n=1 Tax=Nostocoides sp. F2B08 TaxID=2653936 RepID=UPI0012630EA3|nr:undecaprenyldiphospho-muramoylpentapeptide beta-N-acetylglucosaminyltransferase [Tetrasphaera sp. F2B08]KAB7741055.1 undecaprenyldiphospho-muramoylpentapeptide beta-N-acetylglucosaminyltransferase [Tetrasphaera sp. F2B08]
MRSVVLAGGGTAGHVSPLLALADTLVDRHPGLDVVILGTESGLEADLVPARGYELTTVPKVPMPRRPTGDLLRLPGRLKAAVDAAGAAMREPGAEVVVGFGGYVSTPAYLAARRLAVPLVVHEQNARPGLANRLGARLTRYVGVTFASTPLPHSTLTGMPLREQIRTLDRTTRRTEAARELGLDPGRPTLLVTGGSLGAQRLNDAFAGAASSLVAAGLQVVHVTGRGKEFEPEVPTGPGRYVVLPYAERMELCLAAADLVVARSGANTVCELSAVGAPSVLVPLPIGNGEQRLNAHDVVAAGGAILVEDAAVDSQWVVDVVVPLALDDERLAAMSVAAAAVGVRDGHERLADLVERAARRVT